VKANQKHYRSRRFLNPKKMSIEVETNWVGKERKNLTDEKKQN
jgi:hypothetical protein